MKKIIDKARVGKFIKDATVIRKRIAKDRDDLRELISELDEIVDDADSAETDINNAIDSLSKFL